MGATDIRQLIGRNARRLRTAAGLTQDGLAERTGLSTAYISEIERGQANPSAVVMAELAQALGVDIRDLLKPEAGPG